MLVEQAGHDLFALAGDEFPAEVDVVGHGVLQLGVTLLFVFLVDDAVGHDFEETGAVDGAGITQMEAHVVGQMVFEVEIGKEVPIVLLAGAVDAAGIAQGVALVGMLGADAGDGFPAVAGEGGHGESGTDAISGVVVERIAHVAVFARGELDLVEVGPVGAVHLVVVGAGGGVEGVLVEERCARLVAVHAANFECEVG